jgi:hypothetical protein
MEQNVTELLDAGIGQRKPEDRTTHRNVPAQAVGHTGGGRSSCGPKLTQDGYFREF